jgi:hypothetical protein
MTAVGILYLQALRNHLVADDWLLIYPRTFTETLTYFSKSIIPPEWKALWLRPLPMFLFWLDSKLWPGTVWGPHLINVTLHVVNVYLIWSLIRFMKSGANTGDSAVQGGLPALTACLLYGLHPLAVGSVSWVAARFDVMSASFGLLGLLMWLRWDAGLSSRKGLAEALFVLLAALLSKEQGIVFIMACGLVSLVRFIQKKKRSRHSTGLIALTLLAGFYGIYRLLVFKGMGGYLYAEYGPSFKIPVYYFCAVMFPFLNRLPGWVFTWTFGLSVIVMATAFKMLWNTIPDVKKSNSLLYPFIAASIFITGLVTTAPNAWMTLEKVLGHLESRYALISIVGLALLSGLFVQAFVRTQRMHHAVLLMIFILGTLGAWRSDVQIQAWRKAGLIADVIISQTLEIVPNPPQGSHLIFADIPRITAENAYVFGIGLEEALRYKYGRTDIMVIRYPKRRDVRTAQPERDYVFQYHPLTGKLEKLDPDKWIR